MREFSRQGETGRLAERELLGEFVNKQFRVAYEKYRESRAEYTTRM